MVRTEVLDHPDQIEPHWGAWDALAVQLGRPFCAPAWMMAWWRHAAPPGAALRVIVIRDGDEIIGVAPFFAHRSFGGVVRYRLLAASTSTPLDVLARPGCEPLVAGAVAGALATASPRLDVVMFDGIASTSPWPALLCAAWPERGRLQMHPQVVQPSPFISLHPGGYAEWMDTKSTHFRKYVRRTRRQLEGLGITTHLCIEADEVPQRVRAFARLHRQRWSDRGGSGVLTDGIEQMLEEVGRGLIADGRFRIWSLEVGGEVISAQVCLSAGGETCLWLNGFDEAWARVHPALMTIQAAVEHAFGADDQRVDLGPGGQAFKSRLTNDTEPVLWTLAVRSGARAALARMQMARLRTRIGLAQRLSPAAKQAIRRALRRRRPVRADA